MYEADLKEQQTLDVLKKWFLNRKKKKLNFYVDQEIHYGQTEKTWKKEIEKNTKFGKWEKKMATLIISFIALRGKKRK